MNVNVVKPGLAMSKMTQELKIALVIQLATAILIDALGCSKTTSTLDRCRSHLLFHYLDTTV